MLRLCSRLQFSGEQYQSIVPDVEKDERKVVTRPAMKHRTTSLLIPQHQQSAQWLFLPYVMALINHIPSSKSVVLLSPGP